MNLSDFNFPFDPTLVAKHPIHPRDHARLLVLNRQNGHIVDQQVKDLPDILRPGDLVIANDSDSHDSPRRFRSPLYALVAGSAPAPSWVSRPARCLFRHMPSLLPRKILKVGVRSNPSDSGLPLLTTGSASPIASRGYI